MGIWVSGTDWIKLKRTAKVVFQEIQEGGKDNEKCSDHKVCSQDELEEIYGETASQNQWSFITKNNTRNEFRSLVNTGIKFWQLLRLCKDVGQHLHLYLHSSHAHEFNATWQPAMANPFRRLSAYFITAVTSKPPVEKVNQRKYMVHMQVCRSSIHARKNRPSEWRKITVHVQLVNPWKNPPLKSPSFSWKINATRPSKQLGTPSWTLRIDIVTLRDPAFEGVPG